MLLARTYPEVYWKETGGYCDPLKKPEFQKVS